MPSRQLQRLRENTPLPHFLGRRGFSFLGGLLQGLGDFYGGCPPPSPGCLSPGATRPRTLRLLCPRRQSNQNAAGDTPDPVFAQSDALRLDPAQLLNQLILRASDLYRVSCRTSADALLKGEANLMFCDKLPASVETASSPASKKKQPSARGPSGEVQQSTAPITRGQQASGNSAATG